MGETYYDVLGVDPDADVEEIRAAYRERVLETHPDHNDAPDAAEQFKRVSTAESVLTDGTERARYDRLGHDAYVRLAEHSGGSSDSGDADDSSPSGTATSSGESAGRSGGTSTASGHRTTGSSRTGADTGTGTRTGTGTDSHRRRTRSESTRGGRSESHHARQRKRRRQQRARQRATSGWSVGDEFIGDDSVGTADAAAGTAEGGSARGPTSTATGRAARDATAESAFRYDVHDWTDDVDLEWEGRPLKYSTAVTIGCLWLLYPVLVASSLTAAFPVAVNAIVFACTLGVIGYVLTRPRLAAALFGSWSVLFPVGIDWLPLTQFSITGLVALGFAWVPFGYAVALWWALRP